MTSSCRDDARGFVRPYLISPDGILRLWELFIEACPETDLVADALDQLAGFHDYHRQPQQAANYRAEAADLRKRIADKDPQRGA